MAGEVRSNTTDLEAAELKRALRDAREQLTATKDVLSALGRSSSDADAVLDTLVASALRLCRGDVAQIHLIHGDVYQLAASSGRPPPQGYQEHISRYPFKLDRGSLIGRVGLDARAQQIPDVLADPGYMRHDVQRLSGFRSIVGAPMLFDGDVLGVLTVWRSEVDPFDSRAIDLLTNFATQAAIGIRTVGLVRDLHARGVELGGKVDQLETLGAIGAAVNSSLDLDQVLSMIVMHAVQLSGTDGGSIMEFDEASGVSRSEPHTEQPSELIDELRRTPIDVSTRWSGGRHQGRPLVVPDLRRISCSTHTLNGCSRRLACRSSRYPYCARANRRSTGGAAQDRGRLLGGNSGRVGDSPANSRRWPFSTPVYPRAGAQEQRNSRWPHGTSLSFWRACRMS